MAFFYPRKDWVPEKQGSGEDLPRLGVAMGVCGSSAGPFPDLEGLKSAILEVQQAD